VQETEIVYRTLFFIVLLAYLISSGCAPFEQYEIEPLERGLRKRVADSMIPAKPAGEEAPGLPKGPISLEEAISFALSKSARIKLAQEEISLASAGKSAALGGYLPVIAGSFGYSFFNVKPGFKMTTPNPMNPAQEITQILPVQEQDFLKAGLMVDLTLWDFGKTWGQCRAAELGKEISKLKALRVRQQVVCSVTEAFFNVLRAFKAVEIVEESLRQAKAHVMVAEKFHVEGMVDRNDVLRGKLQVAELEHASIRTRNGVECATAALNLLMGAEIGRRTEVAPPPAETESRISLHACLLCAAEGRPEISIVKKAVQAMAAGRSVAWSGHFPRIFARGGFRWVDDDYQSHKDIWSGEVGIEMVLFAGGRVHAGVRMANAKLRQAEIRAKHCCDAIAFEIKLSFLALSESRKRMHVMGKAIEQAMENQRLVGNRYRNNVASSTDVVDAEALLLRAKMTRMTALYDSRVSKARLEQAVAASLADVEARCEPEGEASPGKAGSK
jgi:outer membrane protein